MNPMNFWIAWAHYAVLGRLGAADGLMAAFGSEIRMVAARLRELMPPPPSPLWRGLLLEPHEVPVSGELPVRPTDRFSSWTERREVADWFAEPTSAMGEFVKHIRPGVLGYMTDQAADAEREVLFHWSWAPRFPLTRSRIVKLWKLARVNPHIDSVQLEWNMRTQEEVILLPAPCKVTPTTPLLPERVATLDKRYGQIPLQGGEVIVLRGMREDGKPW